MVQNLVRRSAYAALAMLPFALSPALALASGISGVDSAEGIIFPIIKVAVSLIGLGIIAMGAWEWIAHKHAIKAILEVASGIIVALIGLNADTLATALGFSFSGSLLH